MKFGGVAHPEDTVRAVGALAQLTALALRADYTPRLRYNERSVSRRAVAHTRALAAAAARLPALQLVCLTQHCSFPGYLDAARALAAAPALRGAHLGSGLERDGWADLESLGALCAGRTRALSLDLEYLEPAREADVAAALRPWGGAARLHVTFEHSFGVEDRVHKARTRELGLLLALSPRLAELWVERLVLTDGLAADLSGLAELATVRIAGMCATGGAAGALAALRLRAVTSYDATQALGTAGGLPGAAALRAMSGLRRGRARQAARGASGSAAAAQTPLRARWRAWRASRRSRSAARASTCPGAPLAARAAARRTAPAHSCAPLQSTPHWPQPCSVSISAACRSPPTPQRR